MLYKLLADLTVLMHLAFILFVVLGGLFVLRWKKVMWVHIPIAIWGVVVEYFDILCPLTPLENHFRELSGNVTYETGFIEQYIIPVMYPAGLNRNLQFILGSLVIVFNICIYLLVFTKMFKRKRYEQGRN